MQEEPGDGQQEEVDTIDVGEPVRSSDAAEEGAFEEARPDLDERQRRIAEERKPMGPPLTDSEEPSDERTEAGPTEGPTDPD